MLEELAGPAGKHSVRHGRSEDPVRLFRGILVSVALSLPVWIGTIWGLTKIA
ncbi:MAG: hypothetical protein ACRDG8_07130 [Actinomycetota bacterium]